MISFIDQCDLSERHFLSEYQSLLEIHRLSDLYNRHDYRKYKSYLYELCTPTG